MPTPPRPRRARRRTFAPEALEARRLLAYGPPGPAFEVAAAGSDVRDFRTAVDYRGRVTVVWEAEGPGGDLDVFARRYDAAGSPLGQPFRLDDAAGDQVSPRILASPSGETTIAWWSGSELFFRRYDPEGVPIGGPQALAGTQGLAPEFEMAALNYGNFVIYADGFEFRWYEADGTPGASASLAGVASQDGWTVHESDAPERIAFLRTDSSIAVTWWATRARDDGGTTVYDAQIQVMVIPDDGVPSVGYLLYELDGTTEEVATGLEPRILSGQAGPFGAGLVVWSYAAPSGSIFLGKSFSDRYTPWIYTAAFDAGPGDGEADSDAIAVLPSGQALVHYVRPGAAGDDASYYRLWTPRLTSPPYTLAQWAWEVWTDPTPTPGLTAGSFGTLNVQPTAGGDFWSLWTDAGATPGLHAGRIASDRTEFAFSPAWQSVREGDVEVPAWLLRTGDLSQEIQVHVFTDPYGGRAVSGIDYTPIDATITFAPGQSEASVVASLHDNDAPDGFRTFLIVAQRLDQAPDPSNPPPSQTIAITDDDDPARYNLSLFDFGSAGVWTFNEVEGWRKINDADPTEILITPDRVAYVSFGAYGLWTWNGVVGWTKLNDYAPESMIYADSRLFLDYGERGLWMWPVPEGWRQISDVDPARMVASGTSLYIEFTRGGVWRHQTTAGYGSSFAFVTDDSPEEMAAMGGDLYLDLGPQGLWSWAPGQAAMTQVSPYNPEGMAAAEPRYLFLDYGPEGLWLWTDPINQGERHFERPSTLDPTSVAPAASYYLTDLPDAYVTLLDRPGLWRWRESFGLGQALTETTPASVWTSLHYIDAFADFGPAGLWRYAPGTGDDGWTKITDVRPEAVVRM